ncbi:unnamed protein product [Leuciscus chuanchicus]
MNVYFTLGPCLSEYQSWGTGWIRVPAQQPTPLSNEGHLLPKSSVSKTEPNSLACRQREMEDVIPQLHGWILQRGKSGFQSCLASIMQWINDHV